MLNCERGQINTFGDPASRGRVLASCPRAVVVVTVFAGMRYVSIAVDGSPGARKMGSEATEGMAWDAAACKLGDPEYRRAIGIDGGYA